MMRIAAAHYQPMALLRRGDPHIHGLLVTLGIVVLLIIVSGLLFSDQSYSFGYCSSDTICKGIGTDQFCIGARDQSYSCKNPVTSNETYRMAEVKCALQAQVLCKNASIGDDWASEATYQNRTCQEWAQQHKEMELLSCSDAFPLATEYNTIG